MGLGASDGPRGLPLQLSGHDLLPHLQSYVGARPWHLPELKPKLEAAVPEWA